MKSAKFDDFGNFFKTIFVILGLFFAQNEKYPEITVFDKKKNQKNSLVSFLYFQYHIYHSYIMHFIIVFVCFVFCNVLVHFLPF